MPIVPESIADQLRLWEAEDKRISIEHGYLYDDFPSGMYDLPSRGANVVEVD